MNDEWGRADGLKLPYLPQSSVVGQDSPGNDRRSDTHHTPQKDDMAGRKHGKMMWKACPS